MQHRKDIDGLRALAVLPIVLFHAGVETLHGGFIGVDIFFVISGFLITSIIMTDMDAGRFSLLRFYHRRVVRILPALLVMLSVVIVAGCALMLTQELRGLTPSVAAAAGFVSNLYFWKTTGYFDASAESKPLLHTWSLGVEEQFYIFFPLLIIVLHRFARPYLPALVLATTLLSFAVSLWATSTAPSSAFYLLPSRAWELGAGACVALGLAPSVSSRALRSGLALLGFALVVVGLFAIRSDTAFPAPAALLPSMGAALLIAYGMQGPTARLFSMAPMVWIGEISYSLYLWHWPIITFYRLEYGATLDTQATVLLVAASIVAGAVSRSAIELPFLSRFRPARPAITVPVGLGAIVAICGVAFVVHQNAASITATPPEAARIADFVDYPSSPEHVAQTGLGTCFISGTEGLNVDRCFRTVPGKRNILLIGDSHASQYWGALRERFPDLHVVQVTVSGCRPLLEPTGLPACTKAMREVFANRLPGSGIRDIVLAGRWKSGELDQIDATVRHLVTSGHRVTVIGPTVEYDSSFPLLLARAVMRDKPEQVLQHLHTGRFDVDRAMAPRVTAAGARYVSQVEVECPGKQCRLFAEDGSPYHIDYGHLTASAAREVISRMPPL